MTFEIPIFRATRWSTWERTDWSRSYTVDAKWGRVGWCGPVIWTRLWLSSL